MSELAPLAALPPIASPTGLPGAALVAVAGINRRCRARAMHVSLRGAGARPALRER